MKIKYTPHFLHRLEDLFAESDYLLRYEKGSFQAGHCVIHQNRVVIVNKFYPLEGKINCLVDILRTLALDAERLSERNRQLLGDLLQIN